MATFNVDPEDFTDEMSQELDDLLAQNQADQTALSREQLSTNVRIKGNENCPRTTRPDQSD